ncbi:MAG TPA: site-specific DNA-methyltransferase [Rhodocyclaceae bacterium]|nr:site-specific DNA-methyltransferase [Rhodocyclaceae bacterium]
MTVDIRVGDARSVLADLADCSVHCVVTSPPYFGLRDYGVAGQIGLEPTLDGYIAEMVAVFREVRRVLRDDGTCWLNLGDSYSTRANGSCETSDTGVHSVQHAAARRDISLRSRGMSPGFKHKDLLMVPARAAIALQEDGWWLRSDIIWSKPNPMPESVIDRPTNSHEHVFLLAKSDGPTFWMHREGLGSRVQPAPDHRWVDWDAEGVEQADEPVDWQTERSHLDGRRKRWRRINLWEGRSYFFDAEAIKEDGTIPAGTRAAKGSNVRSELKDVNSRPPEYWEYDGTRNARNVWTIATQPFSGAHFATMPPRLVERCIAAGTSQAGCCSVCGAPHVRTLIRTKAIIRKSERNDDRGTRTRVSGTQVAAASAETIGWSASCSCPGADVVPCVVLDPFGGAGTTGLVADRMQRDAVLIEINPEYANLARARIAGDAPLFASGHDAA